MNDYFAKEEMQKADEIYGGLFNIMQNFVKLIMIVSDEEREKAMKDKNLLENLVILLLGDG